jgi:hypothetical protein
MIFGVQNVLWAVASYSLAFLLVRSTKVEHFLHAAPNYFISLHHKLLKACYPSSMSVLSLWRDVTYHTKFVSLHMYDICCCYSRSWRLVVTMSLNCNHQRAYCSSLRWYMSMDPRRNNIDRGNRRTLRKNLSTTFVCHKSHMYWPGL